MSEETKNEPIVEQIDGSFYKHYKKGAQEFLEFVRKVGEDGLSSGVLLPNDHSAVQRGLSIINSKSPELFPLLAKIINEENPSFWDECVVENVWSLMGAVFLVAQHSGITRSAKDYILSNQSTRTHVLTEQSARARAGRAARTNGKNKRLRSAILTAAQNAQLVASGKFAESIEAEVWNILGVDSGSRGYSRRTIERQISAILEERESS